VKHEETMQDTGQSPLGIACFGEILLRLTAPAGELMLQSPTLSVHVGGAEANVAVSLARMGQIAKMVSIVPSNPLGKAAIGELRRHGVDTTSIKHFDGRMGLYFLTPGSGHRPAEVLYDREGSAFTAAQSDPFDWDHILSGVQWLHLSGITPALGHFTTVAALRAVRSACSRGIAVSFDFNYRAKLWERTRSDSRSVLRDIVGCADLLFASERDIALILTENFDGGNPTDRFALAAAAALAAFKKVRYIATTFRDQRSVDDQDLSAALVTRGATHTTAAYTLGPVVDRIGSGDAFAAGILHGFQQEWGLQSSLDFGLAAACLKHSIAGDFNLCGEENILHLMKNGGFGIKR
jgi:2-dehydro-3-deoxygluconokinase